MIETAEKIDEALFTDFVEMMHQQHLEDPMITDWALYEQLKACIPNYEISYETGIKIITEKIDL